MDKIDKKYVRVKWGEIYKANELIYEHRMNRIAWFHEKTLIMIYAENIVAQSNDLRDLCDEYVVYSAEEKHSIVYSDLDWAIDKAGRLANDTTIYGAVWALNKKGAPVLNPVAILEEGGLKLL